MEKPTPRERPSNAWIWPSTWSLIDHKAAASRQGKLNQCDRQQLVRKIKEHLQDDRRHRTAAVGASIVGHLEGGELAEAWKCLEGWYAAAGDRPPKPCNETMVTQTSERVKLYRKVPPPGDPIPINVEPKEVEDTCPGDVELRDVVRGLRNGRAGGTTGIRAETIKGWLWAVGKEEKEEEGNAGAGDTWRTFINLIKKIWEKG